MSTDQKKQGKLVVSHRTTDDQVLCVSMVNEKGDTIGSVTIYAEGLVEMSVSAGRQKKDIIVDSIGRESLNVSVFKANNTSTGR